jgi:hypothetical protein
MGPNFQVCSAEAATAYYTANPAIPICYHLSPCVDRDGKVTGWESTGSPPTWNWDPPPP